MLLQLQPYFSSHLLFTVRLRPITDTRIDIRLPHESHASLDVVILRDGPKCVIMNRELRSPSLSH
jgi:hypothetical protein